MKPLLALCLLTFIASIHVLGQDRPPLITKDSTGRETIIVPAQPVPAVKKVPERRWGDAGAGFGLDYGGVFGLKATFYPVKYMGVFLAAGWEIVGFGWNVGVIGRAIPADGKHGARPYLKLMYGVNSATKVTGKSSYDKLFYGFTAGIGLEARFGKEKKHGLNIDLNVPFRSPEFYSQVNTMNNDPQLATDVTVLPVAFSLGYMVEF